MKRRESIRICADILEAIQKGGSRSALVEKTRMNFDRFKLYIDCLVKGGLVAETETFSHKVTRRSWAITEKGYEFIKRYRGLRELLPAHLKN